MKRALARKGNTRNWPLRRGLHLGLGLLSSSLREEKSKPGHIVVSFSADRAHLDKITLRVVAGVQRDMTGYELRVKDFVDPEKVR